MKNVTAMVIVGPHSVEVVTSADDPETIAAATARQSGQVPLDHSVRRADSLSAAGQIAESAAVVPRRT